VRVWLGCYVGVLWNSVSFAVNTESDMTNRRTPVISSRGSPLVRTFSCILLNMLHAVLCKGKQAFDKNNVESRLQATKFVHDHDNKP